MDLKKPQRGIGPYIKLSLAFASGGEELSYKELWRRTGLSKRTLSKILRELVEKGLIERESLSRKRVFYRFKDPYFAELITKSLWHELGRPSYHEYQRMISEMSEASEEAEKSVEFFASLAFSRPKGRFCYTPISGHLLFYPDGLNGVAIDLGDVPGPERPEIPERLNLMQCLTRFLRHYGLAAFTRNQLESFGIKFDNYGPVPSRETIEKIWKLKKLWGVEYVERPRTETARKISNLIYLTWLKRNALKNFVDSSISIYIL